MKACTKCGRAGEFHKNKYSSDGLQTMCKTCRCEASAKSMSDKYAKLRPVIVARLGSRCCSKDCRWLNEDGTFGCTDQRALQIDHKLGGGSQEARDSGSVLAYYRAMAKMSDSDLLEKYQLLCACCNWIKRYTHAEHKRASLTS